MNVDVTLRRSQLLVSATDKEVLANAAESNADEVILDLEDSVKPELKVKARDQINNALEKYDWGDKIVSCRINGLNTKWWYQDIIDIVGSSTPDLDSLVLPKIHSSDMVTAVDLLLSQVEENNGIAQGKIGLEVQIESAQGMTNISEIAKAEERLEALIFGPGDYSASIGISGFATDQRSNYPGHYWHYTLSRLVHAAKGASVQAIDGMYANYEDEKGYREACQHAKLLGCDGKWTIHPHQVTIANDVFSPSEEEAQLASDIVNAYTEALEQGKQTVTFQGEVIDETTFEMAAVTVERAKQAEVL